jgi:hypothetical protein
MKPVERINTQHKPQRMSAPAKNRVNRYSCNNYRYVPRNSVCSTYKFTVAKLIERQAPHCIVIFLVIG